MENDVHFTCMLFRKDKDSVFAIMPYEIVTYSGDVMLYTRIGQHSHGDYNTCILQSRPATMEEYTPLVTELQNIGYRVQIIKRRNHVKYIQKLNKMRNENL